MTALDSLASEPRWVAWRNELRGKEGKPTKVPYAPNDGSKAKADDPSTWGSRRQAEVQAANIINGLGGGIGIELGDLGGEVFLAGIDLDSCLGEDGTLANWARPFLAAVPSYTEISPSGHGLKALFYMAAQHVRPFIQLAGVANKHQWGLSRSIPGEAAKTDHGPGIELYTSGRFFAVTGNHWPGQPDAVAMLDWPALERLARLIPPPATPKGKSNDADNSRSAKAFREGAKLRREGKTFAEVCAELRANPDTAAWVREKGEAYGGRELRRIWERAAPVTLVEHNRLSLDDFYAYMPMHNYIFVPTE